jgi:hypothetical protein
MSNESKVSIGSGILGTKEKHPGSAGTYVIQASLPALWEIRAGMVVGSHEGWQSLGTRMGGKWKVDERD